MSVDPLFTYRVETSFFGKRPTLPTWGYPSTYELSAAWVFLAGSGALQSKPLMNSCLGWNLALKTLLLNGDDPDDYSGYLMHSIADSTICVGHCRVREKSHARFERPFRWVISLLHCLWGQCHFSCIRVKSAKLADYVTYFADATQNEIKIEDAKALVKPGVKLVAEYLLTQEP